MNMIRNKFMALIAAIAVMTGVVMAAPTGAPAQARAQQQLAKQVRKELVTLPWYGVFDNLAYKIEGDTVTLYGQVVRPSTRSDAERRVSKLEGVDRVINKIEVMPLSSFDDDIRARTYRAVFGRYGLQRYAMGANPSIHIIVRNGNVALEGVVANRMDKQLAYMAARQVPYVFSVTNNLVVESENKRLS
ncbi:MAG TPA: BON domain-containing protein [Blastocatellia bacterium]|nr:BON domain-containing protein [Blastocatellia bacterium]